MEKHGKKLGCRVQVGTGMTRLLRAEVGEMLQGAVRVASVQDQPLKQSYVYNLY